VPNIPSIAGEALRKSVEHMRMVGAKKNYSAGPKRWSLHNDIAADIQEVRKIDKPFNQLSEEELMLVY